MMRSVVVAVLVSILGMTSCDSKPAPSLVKDAVQKSIDGGNSQRVRIAEFQKTDGQAAEMMGVKVYNMSFRTTLEFTDDALYTTGGSIMQPDIRINTQPVSAPIAECRNELTACFSQTPLRASKGDKFDLTGAALLEKSEAGWRVSNIEMMFVNPDALPNRQIASLAQPRVENALASSSGDSIAYRRCAEYANRRPTPRQPLLSRMLGRKTPTDMLPDSQIVIRPDSSRGRFTYLASGEVCLGAAAVEYIPSENADYPNYVVLSRPGPGGYRILTTDNALISSASEVFQTAKSAWVVHADSAKVLSPDLLSGFRKGFASIHMPQPTQWSPDGRWFVGVAGWSSDSTGVYVLVVADRRNRTVQTVTVQQFLRNDINGLRVIPVESFKWEGDLLRIKLVLDPMCGAPAPGEAAPACPDSKSVPLIVDLVRGVASVGG